jgi:hypothetical protein
MGNISIEIAKETFNVPLQQASASPPGANAERQR